MQTSDVYYYLITVFLHLHGYALVDFISLNRGPIMYFHLKIAFFLLSSMNTSGMDFIPWLLCSELKREPTDTVHQLTHKIWYLFK